MNLYIKYTVNAKIKNNNHLFSSFFLSCTNVMHIQKFEEKKMFTIEWPHSSFFFFYISVHISMNAKQYLFQSLILISWYFNFSFCCNF